MDYMLELKAYRLNLISWHQRGLKNKREKQISRVETQHWQLQALQLIWLQFIGLYVNS